MTIEINVQELRNREIVDAAFKKVEDAEARLKNGRLALARAIEDQKAAAWASREAILAAAATDQENPHAGADGHARATQRAEFIAKMNDDLEKEVAEAKAAHAAASGESWQPVFEKGREIRLASARAADQARADVKAAERLWAQGTQLIQQAHGNGLPRKFDGMHLGMTEPDMAPHRPHTVPSEATELALWAALAPEVGLVK